MLPWILLTVAGLLEVVWAIGLKKSEGFTRLWPSLFTLAAMLASFLLLARAMQSIPLSISYAVWVGIGAVGSAIAGVAIFHERLSPVQVLCIALIAGGIVGLKATSRSPAPAGPAATSA